MKKLLCALLAATLVFSMAACNNSGGSEEGEFKMPEFNEEALTEAQEYVKAAVSDYEIPDKEEDFKSARVMLTSDLKADLASNVTLDKWDLSEATAVVVFYLGDKVDSDSTSSSTATSSDATASAESTASGATDELKPVVSILNAEKDVIYVKAKSNMAVADSAMAEDVSVSSSDDITEAKRALAQAQLDKENYLTQNAEALGEYPAFLDGKTAENPDYLYSLDYFVDSTGDMLQTSYANHCRNEYNAEKRLAALTAETPKSIEQIEEDEELLTQKFTLLAQLADVNDAFAELDATAAEALVDYKAVLDSVKENENYLYDETYVRAALANESANAYDNNLRQQWIYQNSIDAIDRTMATDDRYERGYILERAEKENEYMPNYSNMYKTYVQCLVNLDDFNAQNADAMTAYDAEVAAVKEAVGDGYQDSVEYMKVELKYQDMLTAKTGFENAIPLAKADTDAIKAELDEKLAELDADEQERLDEIVIENEKQAFYDYVIGTVETVSEYQAQPGQWGEVHPDYATYQNQHLNYYTSKSSYSGSYSSSYYDDDDDLESAPYGEGSDWENYDYDGDGEINGSEFEAGFNAAIEDMYNEMMGY